MTQSNRYHLRDRTAVGKAGTRICTGCAIGCVIGLAACAVQDTESSGTSAEPWDVVDATIEVDDGVSILLYHDMEGLSGQDNPNSFQFGKPEYAKGQELLAGDVNAVVEGLFAGGAATVSIVDGHGSGNPDPDLRADLLDPRVTQVYRDEWFDAYADLVQPGVYDAVGVIGMHAKTGSRGFASHTYTLGIDFIINGQSITETELVALSWGRADVPVIFASGDDRLHGDLATMPWIAYAEVKTATSASTADLYPIDEAHAALRASAKRAVENLSSAKVMKFRSPSRATLRAVHPAQLSFLDGFPGVDYEDNGVSFTAADFSEAYNGFRQIVNVARRGYTRLLVDGVRAHPDGVLLMDAYRESLFNRWLDVESGRWESPEPGPAIERERYYGF